MFNAETHELLCLFATMVVADKHVYAVEIDEFTESAIEFFAKIEHENTPSEARLLMWFEINRDNIRSKMTQDDFEPWFENLMHRVAAVYPSKTVIEAMIKIAQSDNEVHISEKALLMLVDKYWARAA